MTAFKKAILFIHRWLGFISGLVVFVVGITGCIYCFQDEIQDAIYDYRKVAIENKPALPPSAFMAAAKLKYPKGKITSVLYFGDERPVQVRVLSKKVVRSLFFNPYNGKFLVDQDFKNTFFNQVKKIHLYCFMPEKVGEQVVGIAVIIFVFLMITGIVLWWPKRKFDRKRSFTIKWRDKWKRVNFDLHNVLGFYATSIVLIIAFTGLTMKYDSLRHVFTTTLNGGKVYPLEVKKPSSDTINVDSSMSKMEVIDKAYSTVLQKSPRSQMLIMIPGAAKSSTLSATAYPKSLHFSANDGYNFDRNTGKLIRHLPNSTKSAGFKYGNLTYDIHTGQVAGLAGKILAFLASLISASLPLTGLIIYFGKRNKGGKKIRLRKRSVVQSATN
jgi:uncharacterized iron-regulated membrane protein